MGTKFGIGCVAAGMLLVGMARVTVGQAAGDGSVNQGGAAGALLDARRAARVDQQIAAIQKGLGSNNNQFSGIEPAIRLVLKDVDDVEGGVDIVVSALDKIPPVPEDVQARVATLRGVVAASNDNLPKDREVLKEGLTARQQAMLSQWGLLDAAPANPDAAANPGAANGLSRGPSVANDMAAPSQRAAVMDQVRTSLSLSDDEYAALEPKITAVLDDRGVVLRTGQGGLFEGSYAFLPPAANGPTGVAAHPIAVNDLEQAVDDLVAILGQNNASADAISAKVDALGNAKSKALEKLTKDQATLKASLSARQEAMLVLLGVLD